MSDEITAGDLLELERELISNINNACTDDGVVLEVSRMVSHRLQEIRESLGEV